MKKIFTALALIALATTGAWACTNFLVGKKASVDGSTFVSYSADSYGFFGYLCHYPRATHAAGTLRQIHDWDSGKYLGNIAEAPQTYNVIG
ncbi:MAG: C69 family dipeptidase, partial [Phocaeicola sp.]|nr:C69 family dipeptidase [Phocaeicola sp.]